MHAVMEKVALLGLLLFNTAQGLNYCVSPNSSATYDGELCNNLSTYIQSPSYFKSFTSFVFLPGTHVLDFEGFFPINDVKNVTFVGWSDETHTSQTYQSPPSVVLCTGQSGFMFNNSFNITMVYLSLINCSAHAVDNILGDVFASVYLSNIEGLTIETISIQNGSGVVCSIVYGSSSFLNSSFLHLEPAALLLSYCYVSIIGCTFMFSPTAVNSPDSTVEILGCTLVDNNYGVTVNFGVVRIEDSVFVGNNYGILSDTSYVTVSGCRFEKHKYAMGLIGSEAKITNSEFDQNTNAGYYQNCPAVTHSNCSFERSNDSGISAILSTLHFTENVYFVNNFAPEFGGALFLSDSTIHLSAPVNMAFINNTAVLNGGAVFSQNTFSALTYQPCFFQFSDTTGSLNNPNIHILFSNSESFEAGRILYGSFYQCILDRTLIPGYGVTSPLLILTSLSTITGSQSNITELAADPKYVCLCANGSYQCPSSQIDAVHISAYPGQQVALPIVSIDEYNGTTPANVFALLGSTILTVLRTANQCSDYIISTTTNQEITLLTQSAFLANQNVFKLSVEILPCPLGFVLDPTILTCVCSNVLQQNGAVCSITNQTIQKPRNSWVGIVANDTVAIGTFCLPDSCNMGITSLYLSSQASVDMQCINAHGGILCGECQEGFSVTLGSTLCRRCNNNYFLFLLVVFAIMGVTLVALLFLLNLTVSVGTVNGVIFYANIIYSNSNIIFQNGSTNGFTNFLSVFISWLNLDFGIESCFYNGMDSYSNAWLQFVFPIYITLIIFLVILAGRFSSRISGWCKHNVVPAIATLVLLLYTKILRNVMAIFSFTVLNVDNDNSFYRLQWLYDANVEYLYGKHVLLFIAGVAITLLYIFPVTAVLLLTPCLQMKSHWKTLVWVNKLKPFLDSYQAPFKDRYRFWTGALLLVRLVLYGFVRVSNSTIANLLAVVIAVLFPLVCILGLGVYKKWGLTILEGFLYSNALVLAILVYLKSKDVNLTAVVSLCVGSAFCCFIGIIVYHIIRKLKDLTYFRRLCGQNTLGQAT